MTFLESLVSRFCDELAHQFGTHDFIVKSTLAILLVSLICGIVGSLVVGNRMAFFSDALSHCTIAGISMGILATIFLRVPQAEEQIGSFAMLIMCGFGSFIGCAITYVKERTSLASDTVIGVFFAGALGVGAVLIAMMKNVTNRDPDIFLFGSPNIVTEVDLLRLVALLILTLGFVGWRYNGLVFASFNPSLARSRRVPLRLYSYLFIILLALIVNVCLLAVGALLINAMLIVPAATANNVSRNMRQMFWWTIGLSLTAGLGGRWLSNVIEFRLERAGTSFVGTGGCVVILGAVLFALSMIVSRLFKGRQPK